MCPGSLGRGKLLLSFVESFFNIFSQDQVVLIVPVFIRVVHEVSGRPFAAVKDAPLT